VQLKLLLNVKRSLITTVATKVLSPYFLVLLFSMCHTYAVLTNCFLVTFTSLFTAFLMTGLGW